MPCLRGSHTRRAPPQLQSLDVGERYDDGTENQRSRQSQHRHQDRTPPVDVKAGEILEEVAAQEPLARGRRLFGQGGLGAVAHEGLAPAM
jgi:hypothetical protein